MLSFATEMVCPLLDSSYTAAVVQPVMRRPVTRKPTARKPVMVYVGCMDGIQQGSP
jgi:hypothetical protein